MCIHVDIRKSIITSPEIDEVNMTVNAIDQILPAPYLQLNQQETQLQPKPEEENHTTPTTDSPVPISVTYKATQDGSPPSQAPDPLGASANVTAVTLSSWLAYAPAGERKYARDGNKNIRRYLGRTKDVHDIFTSESSMDQEDLEQEQPAVRKKIGADKHFFLLTILAPNVPYQRAIKQLQLLMNCKSIQRMLECIRGISGAILQDINEYHRSIQSKEKIDLFLMCIIVFSLYTEAVTMLYPFSHTF